MFQLYVPSIESRFAYLLNTFMGSCDPFGVLFEFVWSLLGDLLFDLELFLLCDCCPDV